MSRPFNRWAQKAKEGAISAKDMSVAKAARARANAARVRFRANSISGDDRGHLLVDGLVQKRGALKQWSVKRLLVYENGFVVVAKNTSHDESFVEELAFSLANCEAVVRQSKMGEFCFKVSRKDGGALNPHALPHARVDCAIFLADSRPELEAWLRNLDLAIFAANQSNVPLSPTSTRPVVVGGGAAEGPSSSSSGEGELLGGGGDGGGEGGGFSDAPLFPVPDQGAASPVVGGLVLDSLLDFGSPSSSAMFWPATPPSPASPAVEPLVFHMERQSLDGPLAEQPSAGEDRHHPRHVQIHPEDSTAWLSADKAERRRLREARTRDTAPVRTSKRGAYVEIAGQKVFEPFDQDDENDPLEGREAAVAAREAAVAARCAALEQVLEAARRVRREVRDEHAAAGTGQSSPALLDECRCLAAALDDLGL